ncbi:hypothetical protein Tco_0917876 [Tanacetum coccineum]
MIASKTIKVFFALNASSIINQFYLTRGEVWSSRGNEKTFLEADIRTYSRTRKRTVGFDLSLSSLYVISRLALLFTVSGQIPNNNNGWLEEDPEEEEDDEEDPDEGDNEEEEMEVDDEEDPKEDPEEGDDEEEEMEVDDEENNSEVSDPDEPPPPVF